jgi:hypothetical protein
MTEVNQDYIDEATAELEFYVEETGRQLNEYVKGNANEEAIERVAEKAVESYEELQDRIDESIDYLQDQDVLEEFRNEVDEAGYSSVEDFMAGRKPINATGEDPERQVMDTITNSEYIDTDKALGVMSDYTDLVMDLDDHYDVEAPLPELGEEGEKIIEDMEKVEELMENKDLSAEEAIDEVDVL